MVVKGMGNFGGQFRLSLGRFILGHTLGSYCKAI